MLGFYDRLFCMTRVIVLQAFYPLYIYIYLYVCTKSVPSVYVHLFGGTVQRSQIYPQFQDRVLLIGLDEPLYRAVDQPTLVSSPRKLIISDF